jgi:hypothetical protein
MLVATVPGVITISLTQAGLLMYVYDDSMDASHTINHLTISAPDNYNAKTTTSYEGFSSIGFNGIGYYLRISPARIRG